MDKEVIKFALLSSLAAQPELTYCKGEHFETLKMYWSGSCWVVEAEAIVNSKLAL